MSNKKYGTRYTTESFKIKANFIHANTYDYSKTEYINSGTKIIIICPIHGEFHQRPCDHINSGHRCPECSHNFPYTHAQIIDKSISQFGNKYKIISDYNGMKHPITIECRDHGLFTLPIAENHFKKDGGCPKCAYIKRLDGLKPGNISKIETEWLDSLGVPERQVRLCIGADTFIVDGFDPKTNTVYECYGSYWHGNPDQYPATDVNTKIGQTFGELYKKTLLRENIIKSSYKLVTIWV